MYLLGSDALGQLIGRNRARPVFAWLETAKPTEHQIFASVVSFGVVGDSLEALEEPARGHWRRLHAAAQQQFEQLGNLIDVDMAIVRAWQGLRSLSLQRDAGGDVGVDERLVIATALARGYSLVAPPEAYLAALANQTTLTVIPIA